MSGQINFADFCNWYENVREARRSLKQSRTAAIVQAKLFCDIVEFMMHEPPHERGKIKCTSALSIIIDRFGQAGLRLHKEDCEAYDADKDGWLTFPEFQALAEDQEARWATIVEEQEGHLPPGYNGLRKGARRRGSGSDRSLTSNEEEGKVSVEGIPSLAGRRRRELKPAGAGLAKRLSASNLSDMDLSD
mmetsp:Transcript_34735/g.90076  ORF Transcript_34735/g.90076 Transcript_34735/m.90076 type:complete len:190 (-) Transcript_34735:2770-3339(-)